MKQKKIVQTVNKVHPPVRSREKEQRTKNKRIKDLMDMKPITVYMYVLPVIFRQCCYVTTQKSTKYVGKLVADYKLMKVVDLRLHQFNLQLYMYIINFKNSDNVLFQISNSYRLVYLLSITCFYHHKQYH